MKLLKELNIQDLNQIKDGMLMDDWTLDDGCLISCILLCKYVVLKEIKKMGSTFINFQE